VHTEDRFGRAGALHTRKLVISSGYYDLPNYMNIPGENLSKVHHYYVDPHPYFEMDVAVIGGKNSAAIAALELWRSGARVTLIYRGPAVTPNVKYWIKPDIENRIKDGEIKAFFNTNVLEITPDEILLETPHGPATLHNDFVFAMTGYHPDFTFLEWLGVRFEGPDKLPVCDPITLESNVAGIYLAGVIVAGSRTNEIFIGVNALDYSGYPDCRPEYVAAFERLANLATQAAVEGKPLALHAPLLHLTKAEIIRQGMRLGVDYALTVSCYQADEQGKACGRCDSCRLRREGFQSAGVPDSTRYRSE